MKCIVICFSAILNLVGLGSLDGQQDENLYRVLKKHDAPVTALAFTADEKYLVSGGEDKAIYIWDFQTGELAYSITDNYFPVKALQITADNQILAASGPDVKIIDFNGNLQRSFAGYTTYIWSFDYNQQSGRLIAGSYSKKVNIWDFKTGIVETSLDGHEKSVLATCLSPNGKYAVTGSLDRTVRVWDADSGKQLNKLERHSDNILVVKFHPSGKYFASGSLDNTIRLWDLDSGRVVKTFVGHEKGIMDIDFSPDGYYMASVSADNTVILWEVYTGNKLYSFVDHEGAVNVVRFSPHGNYLVSGSSDKTVMIWKLNKSIFANYYFQDEIDKVTDQSDLFKPKQKGESRQQYEDRQLQSQETLDEIYDKYYQQYLKIRNEQKFGE